MKSSQLIGLGSIVLGAISLTAGCASEHHANEGSSGGASSQAEMMAHWKAYMTPGPEHKVLDTLIGKWTTHVKWWMDPKAPAQESDGTAEFQWVLGGRYVLESDKGTAMGQPFEGMGPIGYDNLKKKYVTGWIDNMGTGIMTSEGTYNAAKKTFTYTGVGPDATVSKYVPTRMIETLVDANTIKTEMYGPDTSGKEYKTMELVYTRAK